MDEQGQNDHDYVFTQDCNEYTVPTDQMYSRTKGVYSIAEANSRQHFIRLSALIDHALK